MSPPGDRASRDEAETTTGEDSELAHATVSITPATGAPSRPSGAIPGPGTHVGGKYRVESVLGEGGMGVVLAATHLRLGRRVALKLLRPDVRTDRHALRLVREAQSTSRLESAHVAQLLDMETLPDGTPYLVLERLDGETLAARLRRAGPLPLMEAADVLVQAGLGLTAAHAAGVIHRDVKPSNIFLVRSPEGRLLVKVLDFGIAKSVAPDAVTLTGDAAALGSPSYMSPEQTRGARDVDERADVWALGVTLFEALSGELPFPGATAQAVAAQVAADPPRSLAKLRPGLPGPVLDLVARCLQKDPRDRCPSVRAFVEALAPFAAPASAAREEARRLLPARERSLGRAGWALFAAVAAIASTTAALGLRATSRLPAAAPRPVAPASAAPPPPFVFAPTNAHRVTFDEGCEEFPWWTPDGQSIVYDGASGRDTHVFLLDLASGARREVTAEGGWQLSPSVSPRGGELAYLLSRKGERGTYLISLDGSARRRISDFSALRPSWSPDGRWVWVGSLGKVQRLDPATGAVSRTLAPPPGCYVFNTLELPDGRVVARVLPAQARGDAGLVLYAANAERGEWLWHEEPEGVLELAPDGRSVFASKSTDSGVPELWRVPLDGSPPEPVLGTGVFATKGLHFSPDGRRVVWSTCREQHALANAVPGRDGATLSASPWSGAREWIDDEPAAIPGTTRLLIASSRMGGKLRPCVVDTAEREPPRCLDVGDLEVSSPKASPDGKSYVFPVAGKGLFLGALDGSAPPRRLTEPAEGERHAGPAFSPDAREIWFDVETPAGVHLETVPVAGGPRRKALDPGAHSIGFSPKGDQAVYLARLPKEGSVPFLLDLATKRSRAFAPELGRTALAYTRWNASGTRVAFVRTVNEIVEVDVASGKIARHLHAGNDVVSGFTYVGDEIVFGRVSWVGDIWVADLARR